MTDPNPVRDEQYRIRQLAFEYPNQSQAEEVTNYIIEGKPLSEFLTAVVSNDLKEAVIRADPANALCLPRIVRWFQAYAPMTCWGSETFYERWVRSGGLVGFKEKEQ